MVSDHKGGLMRLIRTKFPRIFLLVFTDYCLFGKNSKHQKPVIPRHKQNRNQDTGAWDNEGHKSKTS